MVSMDETPDFVWVVFIQDYEQNDLYGVYRTREAAQMARDNAPILISGEYSIEEHELQR